MFKSIFSIQKWMHLFNMISDIRKINSRLTNAVEAAGVIDGVHYIKLKEGNHFFSYPAKEYQKRWYFLVNKNIRIIVPAECMNVLFDVSFRYCGPDNYKEAFDEGKYNNIASGSTVVEIGAFVGLQAIKLAEIVGEKGKVVAVEAVKSNFEMMKKNIEFNNIKNIEFINMAVWKEKGEITFYFNEDQKNSIDTSVIKAKRKEIVPCDNVDNILENLKITTVNFIRVQVNGVEKEALEGMKNVLLQKPKLLVAVPYKNREAIKKGLQDSGYATEESKHSILATAE